MPAIRRPHLSAGLMSLSNTSASHVRRLLGVVHTTRANFTTYLLHPAFTVVYEMLNSLALYAFQFSETL
jgi:hypothetical protein